VTSDESVQENDAPLNQTEWRNNSIPDMLEAAWGLIANAWDIDEPAYEPTKGWNAAAKRWRDEMYHPWLDAYTRRMKYVDSHSEVIEPEYIGVETFQLVLKLLGLPGETLRIEIGSRGEFVPAAGVNSSWMMSAVISDQGHKVPYQTRTVYVPVMIPGNNVTADADDEEWLLRHREDIETELPDMRGSKTPQ
jgi:hypothetical protein